MDLLFAGKTPWNWVAEANFERLKVENPQIAHSNTRAVKSGIEKYEDSRSEQPRV